MNPLKRQLSLKLFLLLFFLITYSLSGFSQNFKIDKYGYSGDPTFRKLITDRGYQLVSGFEMTAGSSQNRFLATVVRNNRIYSLDLSGKEQPYYDENALRITAREERLYKPAGDLKKKYDQLINKFDPQYEVFSTNGKSGLLNKKSRAVILQPRYQSIWSYTGNIISIEDDGKYGIADTLGKVIVNPVYDRLQLCMVDTFGVKYFIGYKKGLATLIDQKGKELFEPKYDAISSYAPDGVLYTTLKKNGEALRGLISKEGTILLEPQYRDFYLIPNSDLLRTDMDASRKYGLVNKNGKIIYEPILESVDIAGDSRLISIHQSGKTGFVDKQGNTVIKPGYDKATCYDEDQTILVGNEFRKNPIVSSYKYGLIGFDNKEIVPITYDELTRTGEMFLAKKEGTYFLFDKKGAVSSNLNYKGVKYVGHGQFIALNTAGFYGIIDEHQKVVVPFTYSQLEETGTLYYLTPGGIIDSENNMVLANKWIAAVPYFGALQLRKLGIFVMQTTNRKMAYMDRYNHEYNSADLKEN